MFETECMMKECKNCKNDWPAVETNESGEEGGCGEEDENELI
jgi:hypothetical protein